MERRWWYHAGPLQPGRELAFVATTGITCIPHDTDIPGFKPAWKNNFASGYNRGLTAQQGTETGVLTTSDVTELVNATQVNSRPTSR